MGCGFFYIVCRHVMQTVQMSRYDALALKGPCSVAVSTKLEMYSCSAWVITVCYHYSTAACLNVYVCICTCTCVSMCMCVCSYIGVCIAHLISNKLLRNRECRELPLVCMCMCTSAVVTLLSFHFPLFVVLFEL